MTRRACDGAALLLAFRSAVANLERHVDEIDALNVFPVPDGDTGSNMLATVRAALEEGERLGGKGADRVATAFSHGALMGARGNSGVITSQIFRGIAEGLAGRARFNALDMANAMRLGADCAYRAVAKPVEGTILTVARQAAQEAVTAAERSNDMDAVLAAAALGAERAVALTPSLLPILREAGVVDAGGQGLYRLLQGVAQAVSREDAGLIAPRSAPRPTTLVAHADEGYGYETMFLVQPDAGASLDLDAIRDDLERIGESVLVAGDARAAKIHVHSEHPDEVLAFGLALGTLSRISIENLDGQAHNVRERRAHDFAAGTDLDGRTEPLVPASGAVSRNGARLGVIAVAAGEGLAAALQSFGSTSIVSGGQGANPSTGELHAAIEGADADEVLLLPNNPNVVLAARQVAAMSGRRVHIVPTRNAAEGLAALLALDPTVTPSENVTKMTRAAQAIQTLQVTEAVRNATLGGRKVRRGETIALDPDDGLVAADRNRQKAALAGVDALRPGYELVTIYYGADSDLGETEELARAIAGRHAGIEVEVVRGGQPHYRWLIAAE